MWWEHSLGSEAAFGESGDLYGQTLRGSGPHSSSCLGVNCPPSTAPLPERDSVSVKTKGGRSSSEEVCQETVVDIGRGDERSCRRRRPSSYGRDVLARHKFDLGLALEEIDSVALARKLFSGQHHSSSVENLRTMSPEVAAEYVRCHPGYLKRLDTLSVEAVKELAKDTQDIDLPAITKLSPELATALTDRKPAVYLRGLKSLDGPDAVRVAEALASTPAPIYMEFLERVSAPALAALREKATITLPPDDKLTMEP